MVLNGKRKDYYWRSRAPDVLRTKDGLLDDFGCSVHIYEGALADLGNVGDLGDVGDVGDLGDAGDAGNAGDAGDAGDLRDLGGNLVVLSGCCGGITLKENNFNN